MSSLIDKFGHRVNIGGNSNFHLTKNIPTFNIFERLQYDNGIYYPDNIYMAIDGQYYEPIASGFAYFASNLPQTWSLSVSNPQGYVFFLGNSLDKTNQTVMYAYFNSVFGSPYQNMPSSAINVDAVISVTDGTVTYSKNVTIRIQPSAYYIASNFLLDTSPINPYGLTYTDGYKTYDRNAYNSVQTKDAVYTRLYSDNSRVIFDPKGNLRFDNGLGYIATTSNCAVVSDHIGQNDFTIGIGVNQPAQFWIIAEQPMYVNFQQTKKYTHIQPGDIFATLSPFSDGGVSHFDVISSDDPIAVNAYGQFIATASPTAGTKTVHLNCVSKTGKVSSKIFNYTILQGNLLPASNMTFSYVNGIDNYSYQVAVGTASVTGMSGTPVWSLTNEDDMVNGFDGSVPNFNHFICNSSTGVVTLRVGIPARTHVMNISVTDGINRCVKAVNLVVPWHAGPTLHVGRGMSTTYPGTGYEHLADVLRLYTGNYGSICNPAYAGGTVIVHPDSDPDYYANDFNNNDFSLRTGWHGPVKIVAANTTGARPRIGGGVGTSGQGFCPGDKGANFNIDVGDVVIDGLEISYVTSYSENHGMAGIRKNAGNWGDITILNCDIHDCDNGIEAGYGSYWTIIKNSRIGNGGTSHEGSGATHNLYIACCAKVIFQNCITMRAIFGHAFKSRARSGILTGNRFYDGERGSASNVIHIPEGGDYVISNNDIQKGTNPQNPYGVQFSDEQYEFDINGNTNRKQSLVMANNRLSVMGIPYTTSWPAAAIAAAGAVSNIDGARATVTLTNNSFYLYHSSTVKYTIAAFGGLGIDPILNETGSIILSAPFALDVTTDPDPNRTAPLSHLGPLYRVQEGSSSYDNENETFSTGTIDPNNDDIRISASSGVGTLVANLNAYGTLQPLTTPFGNGTVWSFNNGPEKYATPNWAPAGRYAISSNSDGSGRIVVAGALPPAGNVDVFRVRATGPTGTTLDYRFYVVMV